MEFTWGTRLTLAQFQYAAYVSDCATNLLWLLDRAANGYTSPHYVEDCYRTAKQLFHDVRHHLEGA